MSAQNNVNSYFFKWRLVYEAQEQDEDKLHFDILFNRAFSDILNDPETLEQLGKVDD